MKTLIFTILSAFLFATCTNQSSTNESTEKDTLKSEVNIVEEQIFVNSDTSFNFTDAEVNKMPIGWSSFFTGKGELGEWQILEDNGNNIFAQTSKESYGSHFDVVVNDNLIFKDLEISVKVKGVEGKEDQGGGPVWRYQDADNYYIARANPLENNFRVYKVVKGRRKMLESVEIEIKTDEWYLLKIIMQGDEINCYFDDKLYLTTIDDTFSEAGKIGLWIKADAVTYFDDLKIAHN